MSRLGKRPISIPKEVKINIKDKMLEIIGPLGALSNVINNDIIVKIHESELTVDIIENSRKCNMLRGLTRGLILNMIDGVTRGFKKQLEVVGLGYKANIENKNVESLILSVGFSHFVNIPVPNTVKITVATTQEKNILITVTGIDKYEVGAFAAKIRLIKPAEPYKGFGIKYLNEKIIRKAGKTAAGSGKK
ncbi:MAG: 50S ribosomal protein L6 [Endomicrobium sp.]|jgi:large subunit ribosomal protein L6|nr:50S ribosomal protein L6 [Endomicrobium sp.]